jgi:hypothetical protein
MRIRIRIWIQNPARKYDPGCSSRIPDLDADILPIPDPGVKKAPDPGSGSATLLTQVFLGPKEVVGSDMGLFLIVGHWPKIRPQNSKGAS